MTSGQEVWHLGYNGPRAVVFVELYPQPSNGKDKAVVTFHGVPEVVDAADLCESRASCYRAAASVSQKAALDAMRVASQWLDAADVCKQDGKEGG